MDKVEDVVKVGDTVVVKCIEIDDQGRINLSRRDALIELDGLKPENDIDEAPRRPEETATAARAETKTEYSKTCLRLWIFLSDAHFSPHNRFGYVAFLRILKRISNKTAYRRKKWSRLL